MSTVVLAEKSIRIPDDIVDVDSFCIWACSDEFPDRGQFSFLNGEVWIDMSPEQFGTHNLVIVEYVAVLSRLIKQMRLGKLCCERMLFRNYSANVSTEPDAMFLSWASLENKLVRITRIADGYDVVEGTPDMSLEVVSRGSVEKDTVLLRKLYWKAGVPEYWIVDTRGDRVRFDILHHASKGYVAARKQGGWQRSEVFGKFFKFSVRPDKLGYPEYTLSVK